MAAIRPIKSNIKPAATSGIEPAHDILRDREHPLDIFFRPQTVALIGASEAAGTVGRTLLWNLIGSMVDIGWGDLIDYLGDDPRTRSIILYHDMQRLCEKLGFRLESAMGDATVRATLELENEPSR